MLIILSPAKTMDMSPAPVGIPVTEAEFRNDAELLAAKMRRYSLEELATLLKISPKLARENYTRYQQFDAPENPTKQALLAYNGPPNIDKMPTILPTKRYSTHRELPIHLFFPSK